METIQLTIDASLLAQIEQAASALQMTCSDFIKMAVERAMQQRETIAKERRHAQAYLDHPQGLNEIEKWQSVQEWGES